MIKQSSILLAALLLATPVFAEKEPWTDVGVYLFATSIEGDATIGNVETDIDMDFSDIMENLDIGFMGYVEHRRDRWSFIGDMAYLRLEADDSRATERGGLSIEVDAQVEQYVIEAFAGYRVHEEKLDNGTLGIDVLLGARYNELGFDVSGEAAFLGLTSKASRDQTEYWVDGVVAVRVEYGRHEKGWGSSFWLDVGEGEDSNTEQAMAFVTYTSGSAWQFYGGYRYINLDYDNGSGGSKFEIDFDYHGPMFGVTYHI